MGLKGTGGGGGEIIQVEGGHIIRAMGRKDRHSKVFTAKGPRDRRVRLSAHTAIQFYDVQDRLGFDRPSKAVDWLMNKAKDSIDKLAHLPPWNPSDNYNNNSTNTIEIPVPDRTESMYNQDEDADNGVGECMKSFFPVSTTTCGGDEENHMSFQSYSAGGHVQTHQDLCLSLHTLQDGDDQGGPGSGTHSAHDHHQVGLFPGPGSMGFDSGSSTGWTQHHDLGRFTRMMGWAGGAGVGVGGEGEREGRGGIMFNPSPPQFAQQLGYNNSSNNNFQRGTLQSSFYPLVGHPAGMAGPGPGSGSGSESFIGFCNPSQQIQAQHHNHELMHGGGELTNTASSSSLSPDASSQH